MSVVSVGAQPVVTPPGLDLSKPFLPVPSLPAAHPDEDHGTAARPSSPLPGSGQLDMVEFRLRRLADAQENTETASLR